MKRPSREAGFSRAAIPLTLSYIWSRRFLPQLGIGHLSTAKHHRYFDLVAFTQELLGDTRLELHIVGRDLRPKTHLTGDDLPLVLARFALSPGLFVLELAVVQDAANRGPHVGRDLHEVGVLLAGDFERTGHRHDAQFFAVRSDYEYFWDPDSLIDTEFANYACNLVSVFFSNIP